MSSKQSVMDIVPSRINGFPLKIKQQITFYFVLPTLVTLILYVTSISVDIFVGVKLISEKKVKNGVVTLIITCVPAIIDFIYQVIYTKKIAGLSQQIKWNIYHLVDLILFPFHTFVCLIQQLHLGIKALDLEDPAREETLQKLIKNKKDIQVYQFFQAFLHALPQACFQLYILLEKSGSKSLWTRSMQICSLFTSILITTSGVQMYQFYERNRVLISVPNSEVVNIQNTQDTQNQNVDGEETERQEEGTGEERPTQDLLNDKKLKKNFMKTPTESKPIQYAQNEDDNIGRVVQFLAWFLFLMQRIFTVIPAYKYCPTITVITILAHFIFFTTYLAIQPSFYKKLHYILFLGYVHVFGIIEVGIKIKKMLMFHILFFIFVIAENILLNLAWYNYGKWKLQIHYPIFVGNYIFMILGSVLMIIYFKCLKR